MRSTILPLRAALAGAATLSLAACGSLPVPRLPALGARAHFADTTVCVVDRSAPRGLRTVAALKQVGTGELYLREGRRRRPLKSRFPDTGEGGYAGREAWYRDGEGIRQYGRLYQRYGPRRVVPATALTRGADHRGIPVFLDRGDQELPAVLYVPVEPGCVFQPYVAAPRPAR